MALQGTGVASGAVATRGLSDAVDFLTMSLGIPYSVVTAQQACSTEMVKSTQCLQRLVAVKLTMIPQTTIDPFHTFSLSMHSLIPSL